MNIDKNLSDALGLEQSIPASKPKQEVLVTEAPEEHYGSDQEEDYKLARKVLRNLIQKGNDAIEEISEIAKQNESARGYEVVSTLIKTVADTTKDLYNVQKMTKDLKEPSKESDPRNKNTESINVEQAVFVGSTAELLSAIKKKQEEDQKVIDG